MYVKTYDKTYVKIKNNRYHNDTTSIYETLNKKFHLVSINKGKQNLRSKHSSF